MTMLLPLFILVGFIAGYFVNAIAYHRKRAVRTVLTK